MFDLEHLTILFYCLLLAAWGGGVKFLQMIKRKGRQPLLFLFTCQMATSCFVGFIFYIICLAEGMTPLNTIIVCAIAGSLGDKALSGLWKRIAISKDKSQ